jgi:hypothetical protein
MSLYRHIARFQPQAIRAKKQTFSNGAVLSLCATEKGVLSLRAADPIFLTESKENFE